MNQSATNIAKEDISQFRFKGEDVLATDKAGRAIRNAALQRAERLGNAFHGKVKITFQAANAMLHEVQTTVWSASEDYVCLKGGVILPVKAISVVDFS